ncbi:hypothetical protein Tco_1406932 [Tanacetum coccineum]
MNPVVTQQFSLDNSLVTPEKRLKIERNSIKKIGNSDSYNFKLDKKQCRVDTEVFLEILQSIQFFPTKNLWNFIQKKNCFHLSRNLVILANFMYQANNREISSAQKEHMPYPRFTKFIISHFISKDKTKYTRNKINLHTIHDDSLLGTLKFVSKTKDSQKYGALIPDGMINQDIKDSKAYKTSYDFATGKVAPKKARRFKKIASPSRKLSHVKEAEHVKKDKRVKRPTKKSTTASTAGVAIRDTPALLEDAQLKKALKKSRQETHKLQASGSSEGADFESKVLDESKAKPSGTDEGTDDESNDDDDDNDVVNKDGDNKDNDGDSDAYDSERTDLDLDEEVNPNHNLKDDKEEETQDDEYVHTPDYYVPTDEESHEENREFDKEEYDELYKDVNIMPKDTKPKKEGKGDAEKTNAGLEDVSQEKTYEQVVEDVHVTLTSSQKNDSSKQSSSISSDFTSKFLNLDNVPPTDSEVPSLMNVKTYQDDSSTHAPPLLTVPVMVILETSTVSSITVPPTIQQITLIPLQSTPTPTPTTELTTSLIPALPDFSSLFGFDQRVSALEMEISQLKQVDHSAQLLATVKQQILAIVEDLLSSRIRFATQTALQSYTAEFEKKAQEEKDRYIAVIEKSIKGIIRDKVKN